MSGIYSRWGRQMSSDKKWGILKNRLIILLRSSDDAATKSEVELVAFELGVPVYEVSPSHYNSWDIDIETLVEEANSPFELARITEALIKHVTMIQARADTIAAVINGADCGIVIKQTESGWLTYPAGEKMLDEVLVDQPLSFLKGKPLDEYSRALEHYSNKKWEECAEKVRRTLEEYLRHKLNTKKGLDASVNELAKTLKTAAGVPQHLINTTVTILKALDRNFNESSKHQSVTYDEKECEFLIYQSGLLMVLLNKVELD